MAVVGSAGKGTRRGRDMYRTKASEAVFGSKSIGSDTANARGCSHQAKFPGGVLMGILPFALGVIKCEFLVGETGIKKPHLLHVCT